MDRELPTAPRTPARRLARVGGERQGTGLTALHVAAARGDAQMVKVLLNMGMDANATNVSPTLGLEKEPGRLTGTVPRACLRDHPNGWLIPLPLPTALGQTRREQI